MQTWLMYEKSSLRNPLVSNFVEFIKSIDVDELVMNSKMGKGETE